MADNDIPSDESVNQYRRDYTPEFTTHEVSYPMFTEIILMHIRKSLFIYLFIYLFLQIFSTREAMLNWVRMVGRQNGFVLVISVSASETATRLPKCSLICSKGGKYRKPPNHTEEQSFQRKTASNKNECPFALRGIPYRTTQGIVWGVKVTHGLHNHEPAEYFEGHEYPSRLKPTENDFVIDMANSTSPRFILGVLKKRDKSNTTGINHVVIYVNFFLYFY
ncbi:hypothetical protein Dimus_039114 [Dionaea muscipula]